MDQRVTITELEEKTRRMDIKGKLKEDTIKKLQDSISRSKARIKKLEADAIESEEVNKKKVKELGDTVTQLEERSAKVTQKFKSLKSLTDETIEIEVAQQLIACLSQIEDKYLDLSWVYEVNIAEANTEDASARNTSGT